MNLFELLLFALLTEISEPLLLEKKKELTTSSVRLVTIARVKSWKVAHEKAKKLVKVQKAAYKIP